ncbi:glutamyl-tRNA synthetase [Coprinopsis marcescibilis]|uniref:Glutamyl-tRNA synthetase n=1 Tax=Coprinopsis marcescibilis TaxID=230819 RepID=A0A5C3L6R6_COPMA|nr:glutamyl-tRNA synthetase [Coprinopsis marcescibilis]
MALYNHLFAKKHRGKWILRIEDTDATRLVPGSVDGIRRALDWAGLEYDYGPGKGGPQGPYFQSERLDLYKDYSKKLLESGHAYRCFCSVDRLTEVRERLARTGSNATYDRSCLHLTEEEAARRTKAGEKSIVRLNGTNLPARPIGVDLIFGQLKDAHASLATDPILLKSDLFPTYHLASVVDDHEMGITHVLRGEEWLPSLPLHLDLYAALNLKAPTFAHLPILVNADGSKMSKRNGDVQVEDYIRRGWEPEAVLNWLALAGWGAKHERPASPEESDSEISSSSRASSEAPISTAIYTPAELIQEFDLTSVTHRNTALDPMKLEYINKQHLNRERSTPEGLEQLVERIQGQEMVKRAVLMLEGRLVNIKEFPIHVFYLFEEPDLESEEAKEMISAFSPADRDRVVAAVSEAFAALSDPWEDHDFIKVLHSTRKEIGVPTKVFMKSVRHALTGYKDGPALPDIIKVLGRKRTLDRLIKYFS